MLLLKLNLIIQMISELMIIYIELLDIEDRARIAQFNQIVLFLNTTLIRNHIN